MIHMAFWRGYLTELAVNAGPIWMRSAGFDAEFGLTVAGKLNKYSRNR
jgi:hypothetical protein